MLPRIPFDPAELAVDTFYPPARAGAAPTKKFAHPVSPKENYMAVYDKNDMPLWIPNAYDKRTIAPRIDPDSIARVALSDEVPMSQEEIDVVATVGYKDKHGVTWVYVPQVSGSMVVPGSPMLEDANDWQEVVAFPDLDSWDWEGSIASNRPSLDADGRVISGNIYTGFFERLISLMDFDSAALALIDEDQKDAVLALFDKLADLYIDMIARFKKAYNPQVFVVHDDWGSQRSPFFSLNTVMEMIVPALSRVTKAVNDNGMKFEMHSCGKNEMLVPAYIEAGVNMWNGQPMNDKEMLFEKYGDKIILGVDPDITMSAATPAEDCVAAAKRFVAKYGPQMEKKRFFMGAQAAPLAYVEAVYEESRKLFS